MKNKIHKIKIDFNVTQNIKRFVNVYIIEGKYLYLIDSGVAGSEKIIFDYIKKIGRKKEDIKGLFLTHSHPDHIGSASKIKEITGCKIYASKEEKVWIEDIDIQYNNRPIPNFYNLVNKSVKIDYVSQDGDIIKLEENLTLNVIDTGGHSLGDLSFLLKEDNVIFIGDAVPVLNEALIFYDINKSLNTLQKLKDLESIKYYYSAWDDIYKGMQGKKKIIKIYDIIFNLKQTAIKLKKNKNISKEDLFNKLLKEQNMEKFKENLLFKKTILNVLEKL